MRLIWGLKFALRGRLMGWGRVGGWGRLIVPRSTCAPASLSKLMGGRACRQVMFCRQGRREFGCSQHGPLFGDIMTVPSEITEGLGDAPKSEWPRITSVDKPAIERLVPGSSDHQRVLDYLLARLNTSEKAMEEFYPRWSVSEMKIQAYIDLPEWEKVLKNLTDEGKPPKLTRIVVPYSFATISTI